MVVAVQETWRGGDALMHPHGVAFSHALWSAFGLGLAITRASSGPLASVKLSGLLYLSVTGPVWKNPCAVCPFCAPLVVVFIADWVPVSRFRAFLRGHGI